MIMTGTATQEESMSRNREEGRRPNLCSSPQRRAPERQPLPPVRCPFASLIDERIQRVRDRAASGGSSARELLRGGFAVPKCEGLGGVEPRVLGSSLAVVSVALLEATDALLWAVRAMDRMYTAPDAPGRHTAQRRRSQGQRDGRQEGQMNARLRNISEMGRACIELGVIICDMQRELTLLLVPTEDAQDGQKQTSAASES